MSNNYDLHRNSTVGQATMVSDQFLQVREESGKIVYKHANYYSINDKKVITAISPSTSVPSSLSNAVVDFKIDNVVDVLQYISLQISLTNGTGTTGAVVCAPLFISRVDIFAQNGSQLLTSIYGQELYHQYLMLDENTYLAQASVLGMSSNYTSSASTVADGASIILNLPIYHFFKAVQIALCGTNSPLLVRFSFSNSSTYMVGGSNFTCTDLTLIVRGKSLKSSSKSILQEVYQNGRIPLSLSHLGIDRMSITQNLSASQVVQIPLAGIGS